jgi:hypothetical protein
MTKQSAKDLSSRIVILGGGVLFMRKGCRVHVSYLAFMNSTVTAGEKP